LFSGRDTSLLSYFPSVTEETSKLSKSSRLAWCYGDLGVAISLWHAGKTLNNAIFVNEAIEIIENSTKRIDIDECMVWDAGLCHGSAGVAHIYRQFYHNTGIESFSKASDYWNNITINNLCNHDDGLAGFKTRHFDKKTSQWCWIKDYGFLTGIAGIGLSIISNVSETKLSWDEGLLISL
jgi:lantibiotic biosynthesis protein